MSAANKPARKGRVVAQYLKDSGDGLFPARFVLPADAASVERMVEQVADAIHADAKHRYPAWTASREQLDNFASHARAALAAIGIRAQ